MGDNNLNINSGLILYQPVYKILQVMRAKGIPINKNRKDILIALWDHGKEIRAEALWLGIRPFKKISISSVYSNLNLFVRKGIVERTERPGMQAKYAIRAMKQFDNMI